jgi:hypothetical protein
MRSSNSRMRAIWVNIQISRSLSSSGIDSPLTPRPR